MSQTTLFPLIPEEVRRRLMQAMADPDISPCAFQVLTRLVRFPEIAGRARAISIASLQDWARLNSFKVYSDREIKSAVKELIEERNVPIGSARSDPAGYFIAVTAEDLDAAEKPLIAEIRSLAKRIRSINPNSEISRALCGQIELK